MIQIEIGILRPEVRLELPASEDSLPVARQTLRSLGETVAADEEALEDAELALTEALANAVEHAYAPEEGMVHLSFSPREKDMLVSVRDFGRGMSASQERREDDPGYGLAMIDGIATSVTIRDVEGTEIEMAFGLGVPDPTTAVDGAAPGLQPAERIMRRVVAVVAAQEDMSVERVMESLLVVELVARHGLRYLVGDHVDVRVTRAAGAFELRVGPLEQSGALAVVRDSEVPAIGSVVERLADDVRVEQAEVDGVDCEYLVLRLASRGD
jgi:serine/threonine-protein kinase RsbW